MKFSDRPAFADAVGQFRDFLLTQNVSPELLWLTRDRISLHRKTWWILRPYDLRGSEPSRRFYESLVETDSSIRIDGYPLDHEMTLAWVENFGGPSGLLNFGLLTGDYEIRSVQNRLQWKLISVVNWIRDARYRSWQWNITPRQNTGRQATASPSPAT